MVYTDGAGHSWTDGVITCLNCGIADYIFPKYQCPNPTHWIPPVNLSNPFDPSRSTPRGETPGETEPMSERGETAAPTTNLPKRTPTQGAQGGGDYLKAEMLGTRGREFTIVETSWEPNYDKTELVPTLHLTNNELNDGEPLKFKLTTIGNNKVVAEHGVPADDLTPLHGHTICLIKITVASRTGGDAKTSMQIVEFDGKDVTQ